jgi:hypothetical protein
VGQCAKLGNLAPVGDKWPTAEPGQFGNGRTSFSTALLYLAIRNRDTQTRAQTLSGGYCSIWTAYCKLFEFYTRTYEIHIQRKTKVVCGIKMTVFRVVAAYSLVDTPMFPRYLFVLK